MKNLIILIFATLVLFGCGGGGASTVPPDYSGTWSGPFSGDLTGNITAVIEPSGTMDLSGTASGLGSFSGEGWVNPETGNVSGDLGSLGNFNGRVRISGGDLVGDVNLANSQTISLRLDRE